VNQTVTQGLSQAARSLDDDHNDVHIVIIGIRRQSLLHFMQSRAWQILQGSVTVEVIRTVSSAMNILWLAGVSRPIQLKAVLLLDLDFNRDSYEPL
jgi:hypothetical protein